MKLKGSQRTDWEALYCKARLAGLAAGDNHTPRPMTVEAHANPLDDSSKVVKSYHVPEGLCGFAWVNIKPGTSRFARFLKDKGYGRTDSYYGGVTIWISNHGQSYERKRAHAAAFAAVLTGAGISATAMSRLD